MWISILMQRKSIFLRSETFSSARKYFWGKWIISQYIEAYVARSQFWKSPLAVLRKMVKNIQFLKEEWQQVPRKWVQKVNLSIPRWNVFIRLTKFSSEILDSGRFGQRRTFTSIGVELCFTTWAVEYRVTFSWKVYWPNPTFHEGLSSFKIHRDVDPAHLTLYYACVWCAVI